MIRIALISCSKEKREGTHLARDLYTSQLFRFTLGHCEDHRHGFDAIYILSAKFGLVQLHDAIRAYDVALDEYSDEGRAWWAHIVMGQIANFHARHGETAELHVFAGQTYAEPLKWQLPEFPCFTLIEPMEKKTIGQRLAWLKEQRAA